MMTEMKTVELYYQILTGRTNCVGLLGKSSPSRRAFIAVGLSGCIPTKGSITSSPSRRALIRVGLSRGFHMSPTNPSTVELVKSIGGGAISLEPEFFLEKISATCVLTHAEFCTLLSTLLSNVIIVLLLLLLLFLQLVLLCQSKIISHSLNF